MCYATIRVQHKIRPDHSSRAEGEEPAFAARLGKNGHQHVRDNFLITRHIKDYLLLFLSLYHTDDMVHL